MFSLGSVAVAEEKEVSKVNMCLTSTETIRFIRDEEGGGGAGYGGGKGLCMGGGGGEGDYIPIATLSPPE